jgi:signal transduction histidine kinase/DNA-binding response OmpR family regulator
MTATDKMRVPAPRHVATDFLAGGGEMGARMRALDWSATGIGEPASWPQSLRTVVRILLTSRFAMWMAWGDDLTFFCNDAYLPTTGVKSDWVLGARSDRVWAEIWPDIGPRIAHVLATGEATWDEALLLYLERSGFIEETYHTFSYSPLADDFGKTVGMLCVVAEVTERVIGERQLDLLRDMGARLSAASSRTDVMAAITACFRAEAPDVPFGLVYLVEPGGDRLTRTAIHGLEPDTPATPASLDLDDPACPWPLALAKTGPVKAPAPREALGDFPLLHWQEPPSEALITPIMASEGGAPVGYLIAGLNPHREFNPDYAGFIELLTGQIAAAIARADEYESAKARAEALAEINRAKTAFFSNISHEFRTPLTLMLGPLEAVLAKAPERFSPEDRDLLDAAHRNAQRLLRLVNALLDFSRIEAERGDPAYQPTKLAVLTTELASTFRSACERAGLTLAIDCQDAGELADVDPDMWEKIVLNLMSNAFKFTLEGGISVRLHTQDGRAVLEIQDTGVGIPASEMPRLFERFHRVQGAKGRSFEGSGIGLALVHDLVELHGGEISANSDVGVGTTFRVDIPLRQDHLARSEGAPGVAKAEVSDRAQAFAQEALLWLPDAIGGHDWKADTERDGGSDAARPGAREGRVLVADDNRDLRDYVRRLLQDAGYAVDVAADGAGALEAARRQRPDLLLTDVMMPGMDGFQLLQAVREDPQLSDLPVVMLSARAGEEAQVEGLEAGADDYLAKPFSARELLARVSANLDMARTRRQAAEALRLSEARLQVEREFLASVLAKAPVGISIVDRDGRVTTINERGAELIGHGPPPDGSDDLSAYGAIHADGRPYAPMEYPSRRAAGGERIDAERLVYLRGGPGGRERIVLEVDAVPIRGPDGQPAGAVTVFDDAGARERTEEALRARVDRAIAEREAAREELHQLQKLETIGQLTGGVAHDFNNLLTPIVGALDILARRCAADERAARIISGAQQSAERARVLVNRLLTFGRRQHLEPQPVDLGELVTGMSDLIGRSLSARITVHYAVAPDLPAVIADPNQMELAILNLCVNARDAMPDGGDLTLSVDVHDGPVAPQAQAGRYVRVSVADTGVGMDAQTLQRAVEPFFSTKEVGRGTGLGLSMVHGLAAQSGGMFDLQSQPGRGAVASIYLPAADVRAAPRPEGHGEAMVPSQPLRILLVDDEELVRNATVEMLQSSGHEVDDAASAAAALQFLRRRRDYDALIVDYMMPGLNGVALVSEARAITPDLPALLITGYAGLNPEFDDGLRRLEKPFRQAELEAALSEVVGQGGLARGYRR